MKRRWILLFIAAVLLAGCDQKIDPAIEQSASASTATSAASTPPASSVSEASETSTDAKPAFKDVWQALYYDELIQYVDDPQVMFNLYDLDRDGTPELLLSPASFHAAGGMLYTVKQGKLVSLGGYGSWGEFQYDFERNFIHSGYTQMGSGFISVFHFEKGEIAEIVSFETYDGSFDTMPEEEYRINDQKVTKDVFDAAYQTYAFESRADFELRKYDATQSTIESVLQQFSSTAGEKNEPLKEEYAELLRYVETDLRDAKFTPTAVSVTDTNNDHFPEIIAEWIDGWDYQVYYYANGAVQEVGDLTAWAWSSNLLKSPNGDLVLRTHAHTTGMAGWLQYRAYHWDGEKYTMSIDLHSEPVEWDYQGVPVLCHYFKADTCIDLTGEHALPQGKCEQITQEEFDATVAAFGETINLRKTSEETKRLEMLKLEPEGEADKQIMAFLRSELERWE